MFDDLKKKLDQLERMSADKARALLLDINTPVVVLHYAAKSFYGSAVAAYETDTLWLTLDVPSGNRDKLMALLTLERTPSFYWDFRVFGNTVLAFNDQATHTENMPQPSPEHLVWGVLQAEILFKLEDGSAPEFDDEVAAYVAACLAHEGLTYAPPVLAFCNDALPALLSPEGRRLGAEMKKIAGEEDPQVDAESALGVQLARYHQIITYMQARSSHLSATINSILKPS